MNRRNFLRTFLAGGVALFGACGCSKTILSSDGATPIENDSTSLLGIQIIDPHAHPDMDYVGARWRDKSASYRYMQDINMAASSFSAVGDRVFSSRLFGNSAFKNTQVQLDWWLEGIVKENKVKLVLKASDIPHQSDVSQPPGAILSIEGGDALEGKLDNIDKFYQIGVRIITMMHYHNNEIGDIMKAWPHSNPGPYRGGLSQFGRRVIDKMEDVGMVIDVAHAHPTTFREILSVVSKPVIDSHTNPSPTEEGIYHGRMRTWKEMELVAKNGGVTCTWPLRYHDIPRRVISDWAKEILVMKQRLGIEHVGLGTDGGGGYHPMDGYDDERDLKKLGDAMLEVGLSREDIEAYMGGNVLRVLKKCIG
jgi:microsomal dipeptidase-like Zn-dependent dipeptidase